MKIILVKIGGSLITDKSTPFTIRKRALRVICEEIQKAQNVSDATLILGHGGGSYPHFPAKKYQTHMGVNNDEGYRGIAEVGDAAARLNRIVVNELMEKGVNALGFAPHSFMIANQFKLDEMWMGGIEGALESKQLPVVYGDVVLDRSEGCTIFSTERVLGSMGLNMMSKGHDVEKIIHCGLTNGVLGEDGNTVGEINSNNFETVKNMLGGSKGTDVTGGMLHKVEETLRLAKLGIPGLIIDGIENGSLSEAVMGREVVGTKVMA